MLACGVLALMLAVQLIMPVSEAVPQTVGLAARRTRPVTIPPAPLWTAILATPIFTPDRKPAPGGSRLPGGGPLAGYAALGAATGGARDSALISQPGALPRAIRLGEEVGGWRLVTVTRARLTFEKNGVRHDLVVGAPAEAAVESTETPAGNQ
jgi:hypothetical protein